jgi:hypothetical protein
MSDVPPNTPRRRFAPRFSLAAALVAMTLCAVGLWYWYRVPFEVAHQLGQGRREVETVRRTWGGTVRHGPRRVYLSDKLYLLENYRDGIPHGKWEWLDGGGRAYISAEFRRGKLVAFQAADECDQRLAKLLANQAIKDPDLIRKLFEPSTIRVDQTPLKDALMVVHDNHLIPMSLQRLRVPMGYVDLGADREVVAFKVLAEEDRPLFEDARELDRMVLFARKPRSENTSLPVRKWDALVTRDVKDMPLIVVLGKILQPLGLVGDYQYGMLWIAERDEAETWTDPTGVTTLVPPSGSGLAVAWDAPGKIQLIEMPLDSACAMIAQDHKVEFDLSHMPDELTQNRFHDLTVNAI